MFNLVIIKLVGSVQFSLHCINGFFLLIMCHLCQCLYSSLSSSFINFLLSSWIEGNWFVVVHSSCDTEGIFLLKINFFLLSENPAIHVIKSNCNCALLPSISWHIQTSCCNCRLLQLILSIARRSPLLVMVYRAVEWGQCILLLGGSFRNGPLLMCF